MSVDQHQFARAILDPEQAVPAGLVDPQGRSAGKRFAVYRNNVAVSLTEALITAFPVVHKLVGDEFFRAMSGVFLRQHPPKSALMMHYGDDLPAFLAGFGPVAHLGYLPDVARLEQAIRQSYHAADCTPADPAALQCLPAERLMQVRFDFAPAMRLVRSDWPIHAIWLVNMTEDAPPPQMQAQDVLVTRAAYDPQLTVLPAGGAAFIKTMQGGGTFGDALEPAGDDFDLTAILGILLSGHAIKSVNT